MKTSLTIVAGGLVLAGASVILTTPAHSQLQETPIGFVRLQKSTPGTADSGNANLTGTLIAGNIQGSGTGLTDLDATKMTTGTLPDARLSANIPTLSAPNVFSGSSNSFSKYLGVGRTQPLSGTELFGVRASATGFAGMNIDGPSGTKPYYGFASAGSIRAWTEYDDATSSWRLYNNGYQLSVSNGGFLGVGCLQPNAKLDVRNGNFAVTNSAGNRRVEASINNSTLAGQVEVNGPNASTNCFFASSSASPDYGYLGICDDTGSTAAWIYVDNLGRGNVVADVKNFRVPDPHDASQDIYYASLEGPEAGAYIRGTGTLVNGKAHIDLPGHYTDVTVSDGMTVQLTPRSPESKGIGYWHGTNQGFDVFELSAGKGTYDFDWEVKCVRRGHEDYKPVRSWTESLPNGADKQKMWEARLQSIANRRAHAAKAASNP